MIKPTEELVREIHENMKSKRLPIDALNLEEVDESIDESADEYLLTHQKELARIEAEDRADWEDTFSSFLD